MAVDDDIIAWCKSTRNEMAARRAFMVEGEIKMFQEGRDCTDKEMINFGDIILN